jgi:hypothetical protein
LTICDADLLASSCARGPDASQKLDGKDASVGLNDAQRHPRVNFPRCVVGKMTERS